MSHAHSRDSRDSFDAVVIGAGIVGAACAYYLARAGLRVAVAERGTVASGTTGAGEGNILISDKVPGPELALAQLSQGLWRELGDELGPGAELDPKGGLVVAAGPAEADGLAKFAATQAGAGVRTEAVPPDGLPGLEPHLARGLAGGVYYPEDMQVQPMMAAALLLRRARDLGAELRFRHEMTGLETAAGGVAGVRT
ncbi:MAG: NAD(P)/FAD-dependent oxidoreductase, partial [Streptosporangiaceae bacterium]